jgi:hypothetical protein
MVLNAHTPPVALGGEDPAAALLIDWLGSPEKLCLNLLSYIPNSEGA